MADGGAISVPAILAALGIGAEAAAAGAGTAAAGTAAAGLGAGTAAGLGAGTAAGIGAGTAAAGGLTAAELAALGGSTYGLGAGTLAAAPEFGVLAAGPIAAEASAIPTAGFTLGGLATAPEALSPGAWSLGVGSNLTPATAGIGTPAGLSFREGLQMAGTGGALGSSAKQMLTPTPPKPTGGGPVVGGSRGGPSASDVALDRILKQIQSRRVAPPLRLG